MTNLFEIRLNQNEFQMSDVKFNKYIPLFAKKISID